MIKANAIGRTYDLDSQVHVMAAAITSSTMARACLRSGYSETLRDDSRSNESYHINTSHDKH